MPFAQINGKKLFYYYKSGDKAASKSRVTLLFIHGLGSSHAFFMTIISQLASSGYSCLAFDTPGSALSELPHSPPTTKSLAEDTQQLLNHLQIPLDGVIAVGHSMGSLIASELVANRRAQGLILIGPIRPSPKLSGVFAQRISTIKEHGLESLADSIPYAATSATSNSIHHAFIRSLILSQSPEGYIAMCRTISEAVMPPYQSLSCPIVAIAGSDDQTAPLEGIRQILSDCSAATSTVVEVLSGVGHWHCIEAGDEVAATIDKYVSKLLDAQPAQGIRGWA